MIEKKSQKTFVVFFICSWSALVIAKVTVFYLSSHPLTGLGPSIPGLDKIAHFFVFGAIAFLWQLNLSLSFPKQPSSTFVALAALLSTLYGASDEYHQMFVPGRDASIGDLIADATGAIAGAFFSHFFLPKLRNLLKSKLSLDFEA